MRNERSIEHHNRQACVWLLGIITCAYSHCPADELLRLLPLRPVPWCTVAPTACRVGETPLGVWQALPPRDAARDP